MTSTARLPELHRLMTFKKMEFAKEYYTNKAGARDLIDFLLNLTEERYCANYPACREDEHPVSCPPHGEGDCLPDFSCCDIWMEENFPEFQMVFKDIIGASKSGDPIIHVIDEIRELDR